MKMIKRIGALALALCLVLALGVTAFADTLTANQTQDNTFGEKSTAKANIGTQDSADNENYTAGIASTTFNVHFEVTGEDPSRPKTQFSYSIAPVASDIAATDTTPFINKGVAGGATITTGTTDAWDTVNSNEEIDTITVSFANASFTKPGIFRYKITETELTDEQKDIGIEKGAVSGGHDQTELYLDVYVNYLTGGTLDVTGAVLFKTSDEKPVLSDTITSNTMNLATYTTKTDGFYNKYTAYKVVLSKTVTGNAGDKTFAFPFTMQLGYAEGTDANTTIDGMTIKAVANDKATCNASYAIAVTPTDLEGTVTMKDGGTVTLSGLSKKAVIMLKEVVDAGEGYNITSAVTSMDASAARTAEDGTHTESGYTTTGTVKGDNAATIAYTNDRAAISPTGVVLRVAPYALMLGAGIVLVLISRRRKADEA